MVELLVASAIFVLMTSLVLQLFGSVTVTSNNSQRRLEILKQAMSALDRLAFDLRNHIQTGGMTSVVRKNTDSAGNDSIIFAAPVNSYTQPNNPRQLGIVRYGIAQRPAGGPDLTGWTTKDGFSREVEALQWSDNLESKLEDAANTGFGAGDLQQVAPGVIRCEVAFQLWDNTLVAAPPADLKKVRSLIVAVVALDKKAANSLSATDLEALPRRFSDAVDNKRPSEVWQGTLTDLPGPVRETLHIYEQTIPLSTDA